MVVLTGGGIKGAVAAAHYARDHDLVLVHVDHGQTSASAEAKALSVLTPFWPRARLLTPALPAMDHMAAAVRASVGTVSSRVDKTADATNDPGSLLALRGLLPTLLSMGARTALRFGASAVAVGLSALTPGDHVGLPGPEAGPDARREAVHAFAILLDALLRPRTRIRVETPLMDLAYADILKLGRRLSIPFERTWTCVLGGSDPCGRCAPCRARENAFAQAGLLDPASTIRNDATSAAPRPTILPAGR